MRTSIQKGVALIWAIIFIFIAMVIAGTMATIAVNESHMIVDISSSTQAYANAKTGTDWAKGYLESNTPTAAFTTKFDLEGGDKGTIEVTITPDAISHNYPYVVESVGEYAQVLRKIRAVVGVSAGDKLELYPSNVNNPESGQALVKDTPTYHPLNSNTGSFTLQYDFWYENGTTFEFGLDNGVAGTGGTYLRAKVANGAFSLKTKDTVERSATLTNEIPPSNTEEIYQLRAKIKYLKGNGATLQIEQLAEHGTNNQHYVCVAKGFLSIPGDLGNLNSLNVIPDTNGAAAYLTGGQLVDKTYLQYKDTPGDSAYVDNIYLIEPTDATQDSAEVSLGSRSTEPVPNYPTPTCTLTKYRTGLNSYGIQVRAYNYSTYGTTPGGTWSVTLPTPTRGVMDSPVTSGTFTPSYGVTGGVTYKLYLGNPNHALAETCSVNFNLWKSYPNYGLPTALGGDGTATITDPKDNPSDPMGLLNWNDQYSAKITLPAAGSWTGWDITYLADGLTCYEPRLKIIANSTKPVKYSIYVFYTDELYEKVASGTTSLDRSNEGYGQGDTLVDLKSIDISGALALTMQGYTKIGIHFNYNGGGSAQYVYVYGAYIYQP